MKIEPLEPRIAPATLVGRVLTFQDIDGDRVTVTFSKGAPIPGMFRFDTGSVDGDNSMRQQLQAINIFGGLGLEDTNISTAVKKAPAGDGLVNIGLIWTNNNPTDLGKIVIKGDLGALRGGDGDAATGPGLASLNVRSMGIYGLATQGGSGNLGVFVSGAIGTVTIAGDLTGASISAQDSTTPSAGDMGRVIIGGSVIATDTSAGLSSAGDVTSVKIGGDLIGGSSGGFAAISFGGKIGSLQIGGSVIGNSSSFVQSVKAGEIGAVKIGGDLRAGIGGGSAGITSLGKIGSITIGGSLIGGPNTQFVTGQIIANGDIGTVKIGRDVIGGDGTGSGTIQGRGDVSSISIGGSLIGGAGAESGKIDVWGKLTSLSIGGSILGGAGSQATVIENGIPHEGQVFALGEIGSVKVGRDVTGGAGSASGEIRSHAKLVSVSIGGSLIGGTGAASGQLAADSMGAVSIGGNVVGGPSAYTGFIVSTGALAKIAIGGSLSGGSASNSGQIFVGGDLGAVKIGRDLIGGSITGTQGTLDSTGYIQASRIGSVFIGGSIFAGVDKSTVGELTHNASIRAQHDIGAVTVKGSLVGNEASEGLAAVVISARGQEVLAPGATSDLAIKSVSIGRNVSLAKILAGFAPGDADEVGSNGNASIGAVKVGGDWSGSSVSAGINAGVAGFGVRGFGINPTVIDNPPGAAADALVARIASITIKGTVTGAPSFFFQTGFVAQQIGAFKAGAFTAPLTAAATPDAPIYLAPLTLNVSLLEV